MVAHAVRKKSPPKKGNTKKTEIDLSLPELQSILFIFDLFETLTLPNMHSKPDISAKFAATTLKMPLNMLLKTDSRHFTLKM